MSGDAKMLSRYSHDLWNSFHASSESETTLSLYCHPSASTCNLFTYRLPIMLLTAVKDSSSTFWTMSISASLKASDRSLCLTNLKSVVAQICFTSSSCVRRLNSYVAVTLTLMISSWCSATLKPISSPRLNSRSSRG